MHTLLGVSDLTVPVDQVHLMLKNCLLISINLQLHFDFFQFSNRSFNNMPQIQIVQSKYASLYSYYNSVQSVTEFTFDNKLPVRYY